MFLVSHMLLGKSSILFARATIFPENAIPLRYYALGGCPIFPDEATLTPLCVGHLRGICWLLTKVINAFDAGNAGSHY